MAGIYFLAPDYRPPAGGIQHIYQMVDELNDLGFDAAVYHGERGFRCDWFQNQTRVVTGPELTLGRGDLLVVPEYGGRRFQDRVADARVVILNQNHFNTFTGVGLTDSWSGAYPGWPNAVAVIATSDAIHRFVRACLRAPLPVYRVRYCLDLEKLTPLPKRKMIAFMPRKRWRDAEAVIQLLFRSGALDAWELRPLDGLPHHDVMTALREAAIFLSFSDHEGFGLPPAEAMAAECYVVGFAGDGGREFMRPEWCSPIEEADLTTFAAEVVRAATEWSSGSGELCEATRRARAFVASRYHSGEFKNDLRHAFGELTVPGSVALQTGQVQVRHYSPPVADASRRRRLLAFLRRRGS